MLSFPAILVALLPGWVGRCFRMRTSRWRFGVLILSISLTGWVQYARTVRSSTLVERNKEYVQAASGSLGFAPAHHAHAAQCDGARLGAGHSSRSLTAIITEATLSFSGVGRRPPRLRWAP